ncbi:MAG: hypothetical protein ACRCXB_14030 [Aeromonadaceae bacterium]
MLIDDIVNTEFGGVQNRAAAVFGKAASQIARWVNARAAVVDGEVYVPVKRKALTSPETCAKPLTFIPASWVWFDERWYRKTHVSIPFKGSTLPPFSLDRNPRKPSAMRSVALSDDVVDALEVFRVSMGLDTASEAVGALLGITAKPV